LRYVLALHGSPRKSGNSELLLDYLISELEGQLKVKKIRIYELNFSPCLECGVCEETGHCKFKDDFTALEADILLADYIILAVPVFFYSHPSKVQAFFERFQVFWVRKELLKLQRKPDKRPKGILIGVGATKGKRLFEASIRSFKYVLKTIDGEYFKGLFFRGVDKKGEVLKYPFYFEEVKAVAQLLKSST